MQSKLEVDILNEDLYEFEFNVEELISITLQKAAEDQEIEDAQVSVSLVSDEEIHELNQTYRNKDAPTDVLSFALRDEDEVLQEMEEAEMLGDIIVSVPTAIRQAGEYGHSVKREMAFLVVHGFLHLIGYDHETEEEEAEMFGIQERVLEAVGVSR